MIIPDVLGKKRYHAEQILRQNGCKNIVIIPYSSRKRSHGARGEERVVRQRVVYDNSAKTEVVEVELVVCSFSVDVS